MTEEECRALVDELDLKPEHGWSVPVSPEAGGGIKEILLYPFGMEAGQLPF